MVEKFLSLQCKYYFWCNVHLPTLVNMKAVVIFQIPPLGSWPRNYYRRSILIIELYQPVVLGRFGNHGNKESDFSEVWGNTFEFENKYGYEGINSKGALMANNINLTGRKGEQDSKPRINLPLN